jgi:hypothetical protein
MAKFLRALLGFSTRLRPHVYPGYISPDTKKRTSEHASSSFSMWHRWDPSNWWPWSLWRRKDEVKWSRVNG